MICKQASLCYCALLCHMCIINVITVLTYTRLPLSGPHLSSPALGRLAHCVIVIDNNNNRLRAACGCCSWCLLWQRQLGSGCNRIWGRLQQHCLRCGDGLCHVCGCSGSVLFNTSLTDFLPTNQQPKKRCCCRAGLGSIHRSSRVSGQRCTGKAAQRVGGRYNASRW